MIGVYLMKFRKRHLAKIKNCYAVNMVNIQGKSHYIFATDDEGPCYSFDAETFEQKTVWEKPGGTMSIVPLPKGDGAFLASRRFMPGFTALHTEIVRASFIDNQWKVVKWMDLPYVHRFDILQRNEQNYFLGCILSSTQEERAKWNCPGYLAAASVDDDFSPPKKLKKIAMDMSQNHGYWKFKKDGYDCSLTCCREGVFEVIPPPAAGEDWTVRKILNVPASDAVLCDIDNDGIDEMAVISPFHGNQLFIYRKTKDNYQEIYRHSEPMDFLHALWGGYLCGKPVFIIGYRAMEKKLFLLSWEDGRICSQIIETGKGPSNVTVGGGINGQCILAANRESSEAAVMYVEE